MQRAFGIRTFRAGSRLQRGGQSPRGQAFNPVAGLKVSFRGIFRLRFGPLRWQLAYFAASALLRRALRRLAALRGMTPLLAALSIAEIAPRI